MEGYKKRSKRRRALINRIILVLNVIILGANVVFAVRNRNEFEAIKESKAAMENESNDKESEETTTLSDEDLPVIVEIGKDGFSWTKDSNDTKKIIELQYMNQNDYPTGCESITTWMALNYMGYDLSVDEFIENYLPKYTIEWGDNIMFGEDPNEYFIGDPRNSNSFGCYAPVIKKALTSYAGENSVHDLTGKSIDEMIEQYVSNGIPVIMWATMEMVPSIQGRTWYIKRTNETFTWIGKEHCLLLAGWDENNYYFYDPWLDKGIIGYEKKLVVQRYGEMGKQALALVKVNSVNEN